MRTSSTLKTGQRIRIIRKCSYYDQKGQIVSKFKGTTLFKIRMDGGDLIQFYNDEFEKI